ncbi:MAG TPA: prepilin-type N-terminal cleavage/methylation domain-containing protein [Candidatus Paceibacterota bacterium]|nr:prepilin-type N-terminal cleavage/methylation domain-containing protein [Candidatus Paceibacterota bacterium]
MKNSANNQGFTLIEVLVSVSIFAMVMLIATGSVFSIVAANKKTHAIKSVMTNLNFALESMMRDMRLGSRYACGASVPLSSPSDCASGDVVFRFKANRDVSGDAVYDPSGINDQIEYRLQDGRIMKKIYDNTTSDYAITATEVHVTSLMFYVTGSGTGDGKQPKVVVTVQGYSGSGATQSNFNIQTMVTQRAIDS